MMLSLEQILTHLDNPTPHDINNAYQSLRLRAFRDSGFYDPACSSCQAIELTITHVNLHENEIECPVCGQYYRNYLIANEHMKRMHRVSSSLYRLQALMYAGRAQSYLMKEGLVQKSESPASFYWNVSVDERMQLLSQIDCILRTLSQAEDISKQYRNRIINLFWIQAQFGAQSVLDLEPVKETAREVAPRLKLDEYGLRRRLQDLVSALESADSASVRKCLNKTTTAIYFEESVCHICNKKVGHDKIDHINRHTQTLCPVEACGRSYVKKLSLLRHFNEAHRLKCGGVPGRSTDEFQQIESYNFHQYLSLFKVLWSHEFSNTCIADEALSTWGAKDWTTITSLRLLIEQLSEVGMHGDVARTLVSSCLNIVLHNLREQSRYLMTFDPRDMTYWLQISMDRMDSTAEPELLQEIQKLLCNLTRTDLPEILLFTCPILDCSKERFSNPHEVVAHIESSAHKQDNGIVMWHKERWIGKLNSHGSPNIKWDYIGTQVDELGALIEILQRFLDIVVPPYNYFITISLILITESYFDTKWLDTLGRAPLYSTSTTEIPRKIAPRYNRTDRKQDHMDIKFFLN